MKKALKAAFPVTVPVMLGYLFVGIAFGILLQKSGYNALWALLMSTFVYAGSMQFISINFLSSGAGLIEVALVTLMVNFRQIFYGLSFLDVFNKMKSKKAYMIFSLTDETYSLLCSSKTPEGVDKNLFYFSIALLNQSYWVVGSVLGSIAGSFITFNTKGIDFAMTALFVVIFTEQWISSKSKLPALVGLACSIVCLLVFGVDNLIIPSMALIVLLLTLCRKRIEGVQAAKKEDEAECHHL